MDSAGSRHLAAQSRGPQPPKSSQNTSTANTYRPQDLWALDRRSRRALGDHLVYAADHTVQLLGNHDIPYAIMGGFSLRIRGSPRLTVDVDLAVGATMQQLRAALASDPQVRLPLGPVSGVMRIFVSVGGPFHPGLDEVPVCVDLISEASLGAPGNTLAASEDIEGETERGPRRYRVLNIEHLLKAKMAAFAARGGPESNDFGDIMWLLTGSYADQVGEVSASVPVEQRRAFFAAVERLVERGVAAAQIQHIRHLLCLD